MFERFVQENIILAEPFIKISATEVYERYLEFCDFYEMNPFGKKEFYKKVERFGLIRNNRKYNGWFLRRCPY